MRRKLRRELLEGKTIVIFRAAIRSSQTLDPYERKLVYFLNWANLSCDAFVETAKSNLPEAERLVIKFIIEEKQRVTRREITGGTMANTVKVVRLLLEMNDIILNWKKIKRLMPPVRRYADDRLPTKEELTKIIDAADLRGKAMTLSFISSGIREGAIPTLKVCSLSAVEQYGQTVCGRIVVYAGEPEQYVTFVSPEAYNAIMNYIGYRQSRGETIRKESPLFRDRFEDAYPYSQIKRPKPEKPKAIQEHGIRMYYNRLFHILGLREGKKKRHEFSVHGFRKIFKTFAESAGMKPIEVETLLAHSTGISDSYYRPTEADLLTAYLKIVKNLQITEAAELKVKLEEQETSFDQKFHLLEEKLNRALSSALPGFASQTKGQQ